MSVNALRFFYRRYDRNEQQAFWWSAILLSHCNTRVQNGGRRELTLCWWPDKSIFSIFIALFFSSDRVSLSCSVIIRLFKQLSKYSRSFRSSGKFNISFRNGNCFATTYRIVGTLSSVKHPVIVQVNLDWCDSSVTLPTFSKDLQFLIWKMTRQGLNFELFSVTKSLISKYFEI